MTIRVCSASRGCWSFYIRERMRPSAACRGQRCCDAIDARAQHPGASARGGASRPALDVQEHPRMLPVRVLLVADPPRLPERVLDGVDTELPWRVRGDELRHAPVERIAPGAIGQRPRLEIERVV